MSKKPKRAATARHLTLPRDLDRWLDRAGDKLIAGDFPGVISTAQRLLQSPIATPKQRAEAYDRLGAAYMLLQHHAEAFAMTTAAVAFCPDDPLFWYNHGIASRYTSRFAQSLRAFEQAAALDVEGETADKIAEVLPFAHSLVDHALELRGPHFTLDQLIEQEDLFQQAVNIMAQQRWAEAEAILRQSIAMGDVMPQPWGNLGLCLLMQRQFDVAETALRRALEIDPSYDIARQNLAGLPAIRRTGKLPEMRINNAFEEGPNNVSLALIAKSEK